MALLLRNQWHGQTDIAKLAVKKKHAPAPVKPKEPNNNTKPIDIWRANIKAQEVMVEQFSEPFRIKSRASSDSGEHSFEIQQFDPVREIFPVLSKSFEGILEEDIKLQEGYFLFDAEGQAKDTVKLQEFAEANYFDFSPYPCFSGRILDRGSPFSILQDVLDIEISSKGYCQLTLAEIDSLDQELKQHPNISRDPVMRSNLKVRPSDKYINDHQNKVMTYLQEVVKLKDVTSIEDQEEIEIGNAILSNEALKRIGEISSYRSSHHMISFAVPEEQFLAFENYRHQWNIIYYSEDDSKKSGILLPDPVDFKFHFECKVHSVTDLRVEINRLSKCFNKYFGDRNYVIGHRQILKLDRPALMRSLMEPLNSTDFKFSKSSYALSFYFRDKEKLFEVIDRISNLPAVKLEFPTEEDRYRLQLNYESPLLQVQRALAQIPSVKSTISSNNKHLRLFCFLEQQELLPLLKSRIEDVLQEYMPKEASFRFDELLEGKLKYFLSFDKVEYQNDMASKFNYLLNEDIAYVEEKRTISFGTITKVDYPYLKISVYDEEENSFLTDGYKTVTCELKGERDKIMRLSNAVETIFSEKSTGIPNEKLREILTDSSKAESIEGDVVHSEDFLKLKGTVSSQLLSNHINERQFEAVVKSLIAEDLFVIQGPPGTGKSTAIAELVWQHIRANRSENETRYTVLVTSETNLAVDNALDKLRSNQHMLIKPLRFGSEEKLEKEGKRFSLEGLTEWKETSPSKPPNELEQHNILDHWISLISQRSKSNATEVELDIIERWAIYLQAKNPLVRTSFYNRYIEGVNVIGATCSSIGKENSRGNPTRFMSDYCKVFHPGAFEKMRKSFDYHSKKALLNKKVSFDLVVQDEASKASPPELALPCLYGKKAIVIGDHRQLPPMVDTSEFIENLNLLALKSKEKSFQNEVKSLIRYLKQNRMEFSISHFEKLFKDINSNLKTTFNSQYRMHPAINDTVKQFYLEDGGLECGIPDEIANSVDMSHPLNRYHGTTQNKSTRVVWLDVQSPELKKGTSRYNIGEIKAVDWLLANFTKSPGFKRFVDYWPESDIDQKQIGVITFYGAQAGELEKLKTKYPKIHLRISPVDRFQGMERNIIIVSLVRSNCISHFPNQPANYKDFPELGFPAQESLGFAELPNRLNVALSRAKRLLIIVGNSKHFRRHPIYDKVYQIVEKSPFGSTKTFDLN